MLVDVQRGGPSTGLPTKTEQADLLLAMYGRHGEAPLPIVAAQSPADCFDAAFEAVRLAVKYRTPVILLTDGYLANGAEPWNLPDLDALPDISVPFATELNHGDEFWPYLRDPETLARPWAIPGTPGLMHRVGGLEKEDGTGNVSYDAREPREDDAPAGRRRSPASPTTSRRVDLDDDDGAELLLVLVGRHVGRGDRRDAGASGRAGCTIAHAHLRAPATRSRPTSATSCGATEDPRARDEPRAALAAAAGRVPRRRAELHAKMHGSPVPRRRSSKRRSWR